MHQHKTSYLMPDSYLKVGGKLHTTRLYIYINLFVSRYKIDRTYGLMVEKGWKSKYSRVRLEFDARNISRIGQTNLRELLHHNRSLCFSSPFTSFLRSFLPFFFPLQGVRNVKVYFFVFLSYTPGSRLYNYRLYISPLVITQRSTRSRACGKCIRKIDMCTFDRAFACFFRLFPFFSPPWFVYVANFL